MLRSGRCTEMTLAAALEFFIIESINIKYVVS